MLLLGPRNKENVEDPTVPFIADSFLRTAFFAVTFSFDFSLDNFLGVSPLPTPAILNVCDFVVAPFDACFLTVFDGTCADADLTKEPSAFEGVNSNKENVGDLGVDFCELPGFDPSEEPKIDNAGDLFAGSGDT